MSSSDSNSDSDDTRSIVSARSNPIRKRKFGKICDAIAGPSLDTETLNAIVQKSNESFGAMAPTMNDMIAQSGGIATAAALEAITVEYNNNKSQQVSLLGKGGAVQEVTTLRHYCLKSMADGKVYFQDVSNAAEYAGKTAFMCPVPGTDEERKYQYTDGQERRWCVTTPVKVKCCQNEGTRKTHLKLANTSIGKKLEGCISAGGSIIPKRTGGEKPKKLEYSLYHIKGCFTLNSDVSDGNQTRYLLTSPKNYGLSRFVLVYNYDEDKDHNEQLVMLLEHILSKSSVFINEIWSEISEVVNVTTQPDLILLQKWKDRLLTEKNVPQPGLHFTIYATNLMNGTQLKKLDPKLAEVLQVDPSCSSILQNSSQIEYKIFKKKKYSDPIVIEPGNLLFKLHKLKAETLNQAFAFQTFATILNSAYVKEDPTTNYHVTIDSMFSGTPEPVCFNDIHCLVYFSAEDSRNYGTDQKLVGELEKNSAAPIDKFSLGVTLIEMEHERLKEKTKRAYDIADVLVDWVTPEYNPDYTPDVESLYVAFSNNSLSFEGFASEVQGIDPRNLCNVYVLVQVICVWLVHSTEETNLFKVVNRIFESAQESFEISSSDGRSISKEDTGKNALLYSILHFVYVVTWTLHRLLPGTCTLDHMRVNSQQYNGQIDWFIIANKLLFFTRGSGLYSNTKLLVGGIPLVCAPKPNLSWSPFDVISILATLQHVSEMNRNGECVPSCTQEVAEEMRDKNFLSMKRMAEQYVKSIVEKDRRTARLPVDEYSLKIPLAYQGRFYRQFERITFARIDPSCRIEIVTPPVAERMAIDAGAGDGAAGPSASVSAGGEPARGGEPVEEGEPARGGEPVEEGEVAAGAGEGAASGGRGKKGGRGRGRGGRR